MKACIAILSLALLLFGCAGLKPCPDRPGVCTAQGW